MTPFEIDAPNGLHGLPLGTAQAQTRSYFGAGWQSVLETPNGAPADFWPELGVTAFYAASGETFYLAFEHDNVVLRGNRPNAMPFNLVRTTIETLFDDAVAGCDIVSSASGRVAIFRSELDSDRVGATCVFADDFIDIWVQA